RAADARWEAAHGRHLDRSRYARDDHRHPAEQSDGRELDAHLLPAALERDGALPHAAEREPEAQSAPHGELGGEWPPERPDTGDATEAVECRQRSSQGDSQDRRARERLPEPAGG